MRAIGYCVAAGALLLQVTSARADLLFNWSYTDGGANVGSGTLTATENLDTVDAFDYTVTSINGVANTYAINTLDAFSSPSQVIYYGSGAPSVDIRGLSFSGPDGKAFNLAADTIAGGSPFPGFTCGSPYCLVGPGKPNDLNSSNLVDVNQPDGARIYPVTGLLDVSITLASAVPEPSTWAMMILGFVGIGFVSYRRRKFGPSLTAA